MIVKDIVSKNFVKADFEEPVSKLFGKFKKKDIWEACVFKNGKYMGVFDHKSFFASIYSIKQTKVKHFVAKPHVLDEDDDLDNAAENLLESDVDILPVFKDDKFKGIVDFFSIFNYLKEDLKGIRVRNLERKPITLKETSKLDTAVNRMHDLKERRVLVKDKENRDVLGFVSRTSLMDKYFLHYQDKPHGHKSGTRTRAFETEKIRLSSLPLRNFLSDKSAITINPEDSIVKAINKIVENREILLVDNKNEKVLTTHDILKQYVKLKQQKSLPPMKVIGIKKLNLDDDKINRIKAVCEEYGEKLQYYVRDINEIKVHIKEQRKEGKQHLYHVYVQLNAAKVNVSTGRTEDWKRITAIRKGFENIEAQLKKRLK